MFYRVGQIHYWFPWPITDNTRRTGRPRTQHNAAHCQACKEGICNENREDAFVRAAAINDATRQLAGLTIQTTSPSQTNRRLAKPLTVVMATSPPQQQQQRATSTASSSPMLDR